MQRRWPGSMEKMAGSRGGDGAIFRAEESERALLLMRGCVA